MTAPLPTLAIFDVGSNAVRLTIYRVPQTGPAVILGKAVELCELGRAHTGGNILYPEGRAKTIETLDRYCQMIRAPQYACTGYVAVATEAVRRADDGHDFVQEIKKKFGLTLRILSDEDEGLYGARGVLSTLPDANGIVADLGGGSVQLTRIQDQTATDTFSMKLGTLCLLGAGDNYQSMIGTACAHIPHPLSESDTLYVIGGAWRSFAKLYLARAGLDPRDVQGIHLDPTKIRSLSHWLLSGDPSIQTALRTDYHMERGRAESMPQASYLLSYLIEKLDVQDVIVSAAGLRDGILQAARSGNIAIDDIPPP